MSARKPTWRMELDQREQDLLFRIGQLQDDICAVSRAVGDLSQKRSWSKMTIKDKIAEVVVTAMMLCAALALGGAVHAWWVGR